MDMNWMIRSVFEMMGLYDDKVPKEKVKKIDETHCKYCGAGADEITEVSRDETYLECAVCGNEVKKEV